MRLLLDTHIFIWWTQGLDRIAPTARSAITDPSGEVFVTLVSIWEVAIKQSKGKIDANAEMLLNALSGFGFHLLPIAPAHILKTSDLPHHHGDPFDRLLIAQAQVEGLTIVTHDEAFRAYGVPVLWT